MRVQDKIIPAIWAGNVGFAGGVWLGVPISDWSHMVVMACAIITTVFAYIQLRRKK